jgi:pterin-4a-carbinolamine dehydratase
MKSEWRERKRPLCLEQRYEFGGYAALREFLDRAADLSERESLYPDIGFGRDYVNITIYADEETGALTDNERQFAVELDALYTDQADT